MLNNSWVVTRKDNGKVVGEFTNYDFVKKFNTDKVIIETAYDYLCRINDEVKKGVL